MSARLSANSPWAPWAGLAAGPFAWVLQQQTASWANFADCGVGRGSLALLLGLLCAVIAVGGGWWSWRAVRPNRYAPEDRPFDGSRRFIGTLAVLSSALFLLVVINQSMAGLFLTGCER
jgi:hypothetical protein